MSVSDWPAASAPRPTDHHWRRVARAAPASPHERPSWLAPSATRNSTRGPPGPNWRPDVRGAFSVGLSVGYRHFRQAGGSWLARAYDPATRKKRQAPIGAADDHLDANGTTILTFVQAQEMARAWHPKAFASEVEAEADDASRPVTVQDAVDAYVARGSPQTASSPQSRPRWRTSPAIILA